MKLIYKILTNDIISKKIIFNNLNHSNIILKVSGSEQFGEGEIKIINYIRQLNDMKLLKNILVYSPDTDLILLLFLIFKEYYDKLDVVKYHKNNYHSINILTLVDLIINNSNFLKKNIYNKIVQKKYNVLTDLVFILSILGDDFIPSIKSYSISLHLNVIIKNYYNIHKNKINFITNIEDLQIDNNNFLKFLKNMVENENLCLIESYFYKNYNNF